MDTSQEEDYSAATTTIKFDHPISLLRGPIPTGSTEDPSLGSYLLAFKSPNSWTSAYKSCETKILDQCINGARIGCSITASNNCKPPWWRNLIGGYKITDLKERERCEERELQGCLVAAQQKCVVFARDKCWKPFNDARIVLSERKNREIVAKKLICYVSLPEKSRFVGAGLIGASECGFGVRSYKACDLLSSDNNFDWFFKRN